MTEGSAKDGKKRMTVNVDPLLYETAKEILESAGTNMTSAVSMFLTAVVVENGLPFIPRATTGPRVRYEVVELPPVEEKP